MLRTAKTLEDLRIRTRDGGIARLRDVYFEDIHWKVQQLVVEVSHRSEFRTTLISPSAILDRRRGSGEFSVDLTKDHIWKSPLARTCETMARGGGWDDQDYRGGATSKAEFFIAAGGAGAGNDSTDEMNDIIPFPAEISAGVNPLGSGQIGPDLDLLSMREVAGYRIETPDGGIGHVEDFVIDDRRWSVSYIMVDTKNWWPGRRVLVPSRGIPAVSQSQAAVFVSFPREVIQRSPEYDPDIALSAEYITRLDAYYDHQRSGPFDQPRRHHANKRTSSD